MRQIFYFLHVGNRDRDPYSYPEIEPILRFTDDQRTVEIVVSEIDAVCTPIFHFHSTAVMNFISANRAFCAYHT